jgi:hypothetical protein
MVTHIDKRLILQALFFPFCGYKLFSRLTNFGPESPSGRFCPERVLNTRLRGSDNGERFVIPAEAGIQLLICNDHKKYSSLKIFKSHVSLLKNNMLFVCI